jgi:hypothetical protein
MFTPELHNASHIRLQMCKFEHKFIYAVMNRLTSGILSEKCLVWRIRGCANVIVCTYTNLDSIAYYTPRLYGIAYCS